MDAIVLAGGYATRLWPITKRRPKMLLPIGDRTVIGTVLDELETDDRIDDVYLSTNERFASTFEDFLAESEYEKPEVSVEDTTSESEKFGVVGALAQLVDRESLSEDTLIIAGDNLICFDVSEFLDAFQDTREPTIAAHDVGSYERASSYGLVELDERGKVSGFQEKPEEPTSTLVSIACYALPGEALSLLDTYLAGDNNPDEPGWFIQWLQDRQPVNAFVFDEPWFDIGTPESYLDAVAWHLDGGTHVHPDAEVENTDVGSNVQVMANAALEDATVEESVVFSEATVRDAELRRCLIDEETHLESLNLSGAVIGAHTRLNGE